MQDAIPHSEKQPAKATSPALDLVAVKSRQRTMWGSGDFAIIGTTLQMVGESLCEAADVVAGSRVLDVACGNGNATLAAARRFCVTTGLDYVPPLLELGRERAKAERLTIDFVEGDAEALPFADGSFDTVLSTFGVMFAPNQKRAAEELVRVCAHGGRIALASWTPEGFLGDLLRTVARHVPPPAGLASPLRWGTEAALVELFGTHARFVSVERKEFVFRYRSGAHFIDIFRTFYGPTHQAFNALDEAGRKQLEADMAILLSSRDRGVEALKVPGEYLEVVLEKG
jgi:ubiquinone/menaquinone biosynthesis C-methylase UbiE